MSCEAAGEPGILSWKRRRRRSFCLLLRRREETTSGRQNGRARNAGPHKTGRSAPQTKPQCVRCLWEKKGGFREEQTVRRYRALMQGWKGAARVRTNQKGMTAGKKKANKQVTTKTLGDIKTAATLQLMTISPPPSARLRRI